MNWERKLLPGVLLNDFNLMEQQKILVVNSVNSFHAIGEHGGDELHVNNTLSRQWMPAEQSESTANN